MNQHVDLLHGPVLKSLTKLAIPIMATFLIQMAYNLTVLPQLSVFTETVKIFVSLENKSS